MITKMIILVSIFSLIISIAVSIRKILRYRKFKKSFAEYLKKAIRPEDVMTFDELEAKYGGDEN